MSDEQDEALVLRSVAYRMSLGIETKAHKHVLRTFRNTFLGTVSEVDVFHQAVLQQGVSFVDDFTAAHMLCTRITGLQVRVTGTSTRTCICVCILFSVFFPGALVLSLSTALRLKVPLQLHTAAPHTSKRYPPATTADSQYCSCTPVVLCMI